MAQSFIERRITNMADAIDELDEIARVLRRGVDGPMLREVARLEELILVMSTLEGQKQATRRE